MDFTKEIKQKEWLRFMAPLLLSAMFNQMYALLNTSVVSHYQTYEAVAVIGACTAFTSFYNFAVSGMTSGFGFYIANCIGSHETDQFQRGFYGAVYFTGILLLLGIFLSALIEPLLDFARVPEAIRDRAAVYGCVVFFGGMWLGLKNILFCTIQALGDVKFPALVSSAGAVTNTLLTVFLIKILKLDVYASALSLLLNHILLCASMGVYLYVRYRAFVGRRLPWEIGRAAVIALLQNGFGKALMMVFISLGTVFMQRAVNTLSLELIAADAYAEAVLDVWVELFAGIGTAAMILTGQNSRAVRSECYRSSVKALLRYSLGLSGLGVLFGYFGMPSAVRLLAGADAGPALSSAAVLWFRIAGGGFFGLSWLLIGRNALHAMGKWRLMPALGFLGLLCNIACSALVPRYGICAAAGSYILKWWIPGIVSFTVLRREMGGWKLGKRV